MAVPVVRGVDLEISLRLGPAVEARAQGDDGPRAQGHAAFSEQRPRDLTSSRAHLGRGLLPHIARFVAAPANETALEATHERVARPEGTRPDERSSRRSGGHALPPREALALAVGRHRRERLAIALRAVPGPGGQGSPAERRVGAAAQLLQVGVVDLEGRAVLPALAEHGAAQERRRVRGEAAVQGGHAVQVARSGRRVDASALVVRDLHVAVRREGLPREPRSPVSLAARGEERQSPRRFVAPRGLDRDGGGLRPGEGLHDAAQGSAAVELRGSALHDLESVEGGRGHPAPVDPAAKRVVQGHAVREDQGAAGSARADAAQRSALGRRVRDAAARAPEEGEARHLPQRVVHRERGRGRDRLAGQDDHARRGVFEARGTPTRGHRDLFGSDGGEDDRERLRGRDATRPPRVRRNRPRAPGAALRATSPAERRKHRPCRSRPETKGPPPTTVALRRRRSPPRSGPRLGRSPLARRRPARRRRRAPGSRRRDGTQHAPGTLLPPRDVRGGPRLYDTPA